MKRRWQILIGMALLALVGAAVLNPAIRWRVIGWARSEAFYQGRPTSYWAREIEPIP